MCMYMKTEFCADWYMLIQIFHASTSIPYTEPLVYFVHENGFWEVWFKVALYFMRNETNQHKEAMIWKQLSLLLNKTYVKKKDYFTHMFRGGLPTAMLATKIQVAGWFQNRER